MANTLGTVYATAGNHEMHPTNAFAPASISTSAQWMYDLLSSSWTPWIGSDAASTARARHGVYSVRHPNSNLRVISVNTNMYYVQNYWLYRKTMLRDPDAQLEWLASELDRAEMAGERVYIVGHTPFGSHDVFHDQSHYLDQIVNRYAESTIAGMFFGHTHKDHFQISYSNYQSQSADTASMVSYIGPSLTPTSGMPAFRVYHVDPVTFGVLDHETYMADMASPTFQTAPEWTRYYSAKEAYAPLVGDAAFLAPAAELTPAFWHRLTDVLAASPPAFAAYAARKSRGWAVADGGGRADCAACRAREVCELRGGRAQDNCYEAEPGVHFKKRDDDAAAAAAPFAGRDQCGVSVAGAVVGSLAVRPDAVRLLEEAVAKGGELQDL
jgi:sphingomyelin phosphodiesterase